MSKGYHQYTDGDLVDCGIDLENIGEYTLSDIAKLLGVSRGKARGILINLSLQDDIKKVRKEYACWEDVDIEEFKRLYKEKTGKELCMIYNLPFYRINKMSKDLGIYKKENSFAWQKGYENIRIIYYTMKNNCTRRKYSICDEWANSSEAFYDWAKSKGYKNGYVLKRKNIKEAFSPDNCYFN